MSLTIKHLNTLQKTDYLGRPEVGMHTVYTVEGREGHAVEVVTLKGHGGPFTTARLCTKKTENGMICTGFSMFGGQKVSMSYPGVKRFTQKLAEEKHREFLAALPALIEEGKLKLDGAV